MMITGSTETWPFLPKHWETSFRTNPRWNVFSGHFKSAAMLSISAFSLFLIAALFVIIIRCKLHCYPRTQIMNRYQTLFASVSCLMGATISASAFIVSDNNLEVTPLPNLSSSNNLVSSSFTVVGGKVYRLRGTVASTVTGIDITNYSIMGVSKIAPPTSSSDLLAVYSGGEPMLRRTPVRR